MRSSKNSSISVFLAALPAFFWSFFFLASASYYFYFSYSSYVSSVSPFSYFPSLSFFFLFHQLVLFLLVFFSLLFSLLWGRFPVFSSFSRCSRAVFLFLFFLMFSRVSSFSLLFIVLFFFIFSCSYFSLSYLSPNEFHYIWMTLHIQCGLMIMLITYHP